MLEMLKARKEALQEQGNKGFTLMEMLIVIAIIAVLIAIAIPIFSDQLERSKQGTDAANIRSAYAEAAADALLKVDKPGQKGSATTAPMQSASWDKFADNTATIGENSVKIIDITKTVGGTLTIEVDPTTGNVTVAGGGGTGGGTGGGGA